MGDVAAVRYRCAAVPRVLLAAGALALSSVACSDSRRDRVRAGAAAGATAGLPRGVPAARPAVATPARLALGRPAPAASIAAVNIDANPAGAGLPPGRGTYAEGATIYAGRCASCHGARGEGQGPYPRLIGPPADSSFRFGTDPTLVKTVGNYWPYATTLYDYIQRAMPFNAPGSLRPPEVYGLVAYLLAENRVVARDAVMDARTLPAVRMPARGHFVPDDRRGGPGFR